MRALHQTSLDNSTFSQIPWARTDRVGLFVPTLNPGMQWNQWIASLKIQSLQPDRVLIIDSSSTDNTVELCHSAGLEVQVIPQHQFSHGGTRQLAAEILSDMDIIIYMTQDAIFADNDTIKKIVNPFNNAEISAVSGRQLPYAHATASSAFARSFNYPASSELKSTEDIPTKGIKTAFVSNSFAAYRRSALMECGGFPAHLIVSEDMYLAAKMLMEGHKIKYEADALAFHSHNFTCLEEFQRYFDIGVFHHREAWIGEEFGGAGGEGFKFVKQEISSLGLRHIHRLPLVILSTAMKFLGFRLGILESKIPPAISRFISMQKYYWK
ncbi:MAG: glycosyltransferase family 2 protein [Pseudomonadales bacterium]|nr:glycosyltransferase family 2 protein [Pseudomonadales bacterium]